MTTCFLRQILKTPKTLQCTKIRIIYSFSAVSLSSFSYAAISISSGLSFSNVLNFFSSFIRIYLDYIKVCPQRYKDCFVDFLGIAYNRLITREMVGTYKLC